MKLQQAIPDHFDSRRGLNSRFPPYEARTRDFGRRLTGTKIPSDNDRDWAQNCISAVTQSLLKDNEHLGARAGL